VFGKGVLRGIFGCVSDEITEAQKLHNEEPQNMCPLPNIRMLKSRSMTLAAREESCAHIIMVLRQAGADLQSNMASHFRRFNLE
jgi:hypothetical protein